MAGQFTFRGRLAEAIKQNLIFYGVMAVCGVAFLIWLIVANNLSTNDLPAFMFTLSTTFGLCVIVVMLGYGLVEVPRMVWRSADAQQMLRRLQFKAPDLDQELFDAKCAVEETVGEVRLCVHS